jgi:hypothetical protein
MQSLFADIISKLHSFLNNQDVLLIIEPETANSGRMVTLSPDHIELLKAYVSARELLRIQLGVILNLNDFIFIRYDGSPVNFNAVALAFTSYQESIERDTGLPFFT